MESDVILVGLAGVLASAAPVIFATIGETFAERSGVVNLSVNGTMLLTAMAGFVAATLTKNVVIGFLVGMVVGALVALLVAFSSITLKLSQVAVGYVLTMTCRDLAYFLGNPYVGIEAIRINVVPIPVLSDIPIIGTLLFKQDVMTYLSFILIVVAYIWIFKTRPGMMLQGVGERPAAAHNRGANVNRLRYIYTVLGGALVGISGPMYSLSVKAGWQGTISGLDGIGWIVLAITIFGAWNPLRAAFGAYLFALLQWLGLVLQPVLTGIPSQVLQAAPFPLMILTLLFVNIGDAEWLNRVLAQLPETTRRAIVRVFRALRSQPPAALGTPFERQ